MFTYFFFLFFFHHLINTLSSFVSRFLFFFFSLHPGNTAVGFNEIDLEGDFDPEEWDKRMASIFNDEFYEEEEEGGEEMGKSGEMKDSLAENGDVTDGQKGHGNTDAVVAHKQAGDIGVGGSGGESGDKQTGPRRATKSLSPASRSRSRGGGRTKSRSRSPTATESRVVSLGETEFNRSPHTKVSTNPAALGAICRFDDTIEESYPAILVVVDSGAAVGSDGVPLVPPEHSYKYLAQLQTVVGRWKHQDKPLLLWKDGDFSDFKAKSSLSSKNIVSAKSTETKGPAIEKAGLHAGEVTDDNNTVGGSENLEEKIDTRNKYVFGWFFMAII
jgi:hypothetical protein